MRYWVDFDGEGFEVTIVEENGTQKIILNGEAKEVELFKIDSNGTYVAYVDGAPLIFHAEISGNGEVKVSLPDVTHQMNIVKSVGRSGERRRVVDAGPAKIKSPMSGLIVDVMVEPGASVEKGTPLIVLEAMKMRNEIKAPRPGIVKELKVNKGQTVETGTVLLTIE